MPRTRSQGLEKQIQLTLEEELLRVEREVEGEFGGQTRDVGIEPEDSGGHVEDSEDRLPLPVPNRFPNRVLNQVPVQLPVQLPVPIIQVKMPPSFRIKYTRFKGDGSQDVDDWMEQYLATLAANDEGDVETTKRLFRGVIEGEALRWYGMLDQAVKADWPTLKSAFEQEFREIGADSRVMSRLNSIKMKPSNTLRSYTQRVHQLVGKLSTPPANLQMEWFISGLPELLDFE